MQLPRFRRAFRLALRRADLIESEVEDEIAFHVQERVDALIDRGWTAEQARAEAGRRFGDPTAERAALFAAAHRREQRLGVLERIDTVLTDLRVAARQLRRAPTFAFGTIAAFALGIGANATMFNVVDRLLLQAPPHIRSPNDVYTLRSRPHAAVSFPTFVALRDQLAKVASISTETPPLPLSIGRGEESAMAQTVFVDGAYFRTLGVQPALGRALLDDDARLPEGQNVAVISFGLWQGRFGSDSTVIGRELLVESKRVRIIGVAPEGFNGVGTQPVDLWLPLTLVSGLMPGVGPEWRTGGIWLLPIARVVPGVDPKLVANRATALRRTMERAQPRGDTSVAVEFQSIVPSRAEGFLPEAKVAALLAAVSVLVLLIACSNVANLMLARAVGRRREIGVRMALGVSRGRLVAQLLADSMFLSTLGGIAAVAVAAAGSAFMKSVLLAGFAWHGHLVDGRTIVFIACTVIVAGLLTGLVPAFVLLRRFDLAQAIGETRQSGGVHKHRTISSLVVTQTALSALLLIGALLFVRSLRSVRSVPLGIDPEHTIVVSLDPKTLAGPGANVDALFTELRARVAQVPGVRDVAIAEGIPYDWHMGTRISVPGLPQDSPALQGAHFMSAVTSGYFATIGTRIIQGRAFTDADDRPAGEAIAIVSDRLATTVWGGRSVLGQCVRLGPDSTAALPCLRIVGIAEDTRESAVRGSKPDPSAVDVYVPLSQGRQSLRARALIARVASSTNGVVAQVQSVVQAVDPNMPRANVWVMQSRLDPELRPWQLGAEMFSLLGALALVLAAVGLYSVISYGMAQRRQEMGVRIALGAQTAQIVSLVGSQGVRLASAGVVIAAAAAAVSAPLVQPLLFETSARSLRVYALVACLMLMVAIAASLIPALRAARVSPISALRSE